MAKGFKDSKGKFHPTQSVTPDRALKVQDVLEDVFNPSAIAFQGRSSQGKLTYQVAVEEITPENQNAWSRKFPHGSSFSIVKSTSPKFLDLVVDVSNQDFKKNSGG